MSGLYPDPLSTIQFRYRGILSGLKLRKCVVGFCDQVRAERKSFPFQWQVTQLHVRSASAATRQTSLPPQTRDWDPQQEVLKWSTVLSEPTVE